ncbi:MAG: hypothetical protein MUF13_16380 [Akkermansiaceae bacterium]|jgi:hypothetical protein|nr:hypothetical protein [Akkermansiaceae bacterium]
MKPHPKNHLARLIFSTIATPVALVFTATHVHGVTTYTGAGDDWAAVGNWSGGSVPAGAFNQRLNFTGSTTVTFTAAQGTVDLASSAVADNRAFVIGNTNPNAGTTSVLNITGGILRINSAANSASTSTSSLVGANGPNSNGTLNVSSTGTLDLTTGGGTGQRILSLSGLAPRRTQASAEPSIFPAAASSRSASSASPKPRRVPEATSPVFSTSTAEPWKPELFRKSPALPMPSSPRP